MALAALSCTAQNAPRELAVVTGKSLVVDSPSPVTKVSVADPEVIEAVGITPNEVVLNGKKPGQTSVILWQKTGNRLLFDVSVMSPPNKRIDAVQRELDKELGASKVEMTLDGVDVYLRGTVTDLAAADRAVSIASTLGKPVNLLKVNAPEVEPQVLLKVKFAEVDRSIGRDLGMNIVSTGATNTIGRLSTGQFPGVQPREIQGESNEWTISDALNIFLFRPDLNLLATIKALQTKKLLEMLAEPNVLAANGREASFLAGGEYPYPVAQGGGITGIPVITIRFREFGVRLNFTPTITSRGTIKLLVEPEVSSLDFTNALQLQGFTIPSLQVRRVATEIELMDRQSFAIAGLLDNRLTETLSKIPGLGDIPWLGKLFRSQSISRGKNELLVLVTPEIVRPIQQGQPEPRLEYPKPFLPEGASSVPRTPPVEVTGTAPQQKTIPLPVEVLKEEKRREQENQQNSRERRSSNQSGDDRIESRATRRVN